MSKAEKTRQYIIEKTAPIFNKKGFAGTSMNDLTEATGLTKGSIYGNFANKDEVALAAFDHNSAALIRGINNASAVGNSAIDKLLNMAGFYRAGCRHIMKTGGCPIFNTVVDADDTHLVLKEKAAGSIKVWKKRIEDIVKQGIAEGTVDPSVDHTAFSANFIALVEGGIMLAKATGNISMLTSSIDRIEMIINNELKM